MNIFLTLWQKKTGSLSYYLTTHDHAHWKCTGSFTELQMPPHSRHAVGSPNVAHFRGPGLYCTQKCHLPHDRFPHDRLTSLGINIWGNIQQKCCYSISLLCSFSVLEYCVSTLNCHCCQIKRYLCTYTCGSFVQILIKGYSITYFDRNAGFKAPYC